MLLFYLGATESRSVGLPPLEQKRTGWQGVPSSTPPLWARGAVRVPSAQERVPRASVGDHLPRACRGLLPWRYRGFCHSRNGRGLHVSRSEWRLGAAPQGWPKNLPLGLPRKSHRVWRKSLHLGLSRGGGGRQSTGCTPRSRGRRSRVAHCVLGAVGSARTVSWRRTAAAVAVRAAAPDPSPPAAVGP